MSDVGGDVVVAVSGLMKRYKRVEAVRGIDLDVRRGEVYGLIGPDGAGKSTVLKAIAGVLAFDQGVVDVLGVRVDRESAAERIKPRLGFMPQGLGLNLYPELSVEENIDFFAALRLVEPAALNRRKARLLAMTRLDPFHSRPMKHLSGGMKQKLALVCALIHEPELVILDEPTTGVDPVSRRDFWEILMELVHDHAMTAIISTGYMDEASRFDRLSLMFEGQVLAAGEPGDLVQRVPGSAMAVQVEPQMEALARLKAHWDQVEVVGPWLHLFAPEAEESTLPSRVRDTLAGLKLTALELRPAELEDVFVALLRKAREAAAETEAPALGARMHITTEEDAIVADRLVRDFDGFRAVDSVSFSVRPGEIFGLLGANGAGKTTVIKMLNGILRPTAGEGRIAGIDMRESGGGIKQRIGYMSQAFSLYLDLTVTENIELFAGVYGLDSRETRRRLAWIVRMAGLTGYERELTSRLPMGVRQRLALGCALVHRPPVLFLDEPTSGVDPIGRRRFWAILGRLAREQRVAILATTHYMSEAEHCDRLALMHAGRIVSAGSPLDMKETLARDAGTLLQITTNAPAAALAELRKTGRPGVALHGRRVHVFSRRPDDEQEIRRQLATAGVIVSDVRAGAITLEDVFVYRVMERERHAGAEAAA